jgi:hypothetical protein
VIANRQLANYDVLKGVTTMPIRSIFFLLMFSVLLSAQDNSISFRIHSGDFPKGYVFRLSNLKLKIVAWDMETMRSKEPHVLQELIPKKSFSWNISYDKNGKPIIKRSPHSVVYTFRHPVNVNEFSNARWLIQLEGDATFSGKGRILNIPLGYLHPFQSDITDYVLMLTSTGTTNGRPNPKVSFLNEQQFQLIQEGKPVPGMLTPF